ncbi:hypothetical protein SRHO_G00215270 [Serrasalmus rhombeus]
MSMLPAINTQYFEVILPLTRLGSGNEPKFGYYPRTGGKAGTVLAQELAGEAAPLSRYDHGPEAEIKKRAKTGPRSLVPQPCLLPACSAGLGRGGVGFELMLRFCSGTRLRETAGPAARLSTRPACVPSRLERCRCHQASRDGAVCRGKPKLVPFRLQLNLKRAPPADGTQLVLFVQQFLHQSSLPEVDDCFQGVCLSQQNGTCQVV